MGAWGTGLYSNDSAEDIRDAYIKLLEEQFTNEQAYNKLTEMFQEYLKSDEEYIFWYSLSDTQWRLGRLMPNVKKEALEWIDKSGGLELWTESNNSEKGWISTLEKLKTRLNSQMPPEKIIKKPKEFIRNPWNLGDVYAYELKSEESVEVGISGKYIIIQKIMDEEWYDDYMVSRVQVFDKIFETLPEIKDLQNLRILPFSNPKRYTEDFKGFQEDVSMNIAMLRYKIRDYKEKEYIYIGNQEPKNIYPITHQNISYCYWSSLDEMFSIFYEDWKNYDYIFEDEKFISRLKV